jgi:hypothetical protein
MLLKEQETLWEKIREFPLNEPGAAITFSDKLQEQQKWTASYTARVIEEYRRFIFLCCIAPKGASPSKAVDEAWHLHLTYTKSYWIDLCKNTLGKDIHHHPSKGGTAENHKHTEWYKDTLELYKEVFGYSAPTDIWPDHGLSLIPEPTITVKASIYAIAAGVVLAPFVFIFLFNGHDNPFSLSSGQFLWFYPFFAVTLMIAFYVVGRQERAYYDKLVEEFFQHKGTVFQKVKFLFGHHRALQTAIIDLMRRNLLELQNDENFIVKKHNYTKQSNEQNPLIDEFEKENNGYAIRYDLMDVRWYEDGKFSHPALQKLHIFAYRDPGFLRKYLLLIVVFIIGMGRLFQGLYLQEDVSFLVLEIIGVHVLAFYVRKLSFRNIAIFTYATILFEEQANRKELHPDPIVSDFAVHGNGALSSFAEGALLLEIFYNYKKVKQSSVFTRKNSGDSCSSCGGGAGCSNDAGCGGCGGDND